MQNDGKREKLAQNWPNIDRVWLMRKLEYSFKSMHNSHPTVF
jgi:hypothetical protein